MMSQQGPNHVAVSGLYNITVNLTHLCAFFGLNYSNWSRTTKKFNTSESNRADKNRRVLVEQ